MTFIESSTMKRVIAASFALMFALSAMVIITPSAEAAEVYETINEQIEDMVVFNQNYSNEYFVPDNICLALEYSPNIVKNQTLDYDYSRNAVRLNATNGNAGSLIVGGLSATIKSTIILDIGYSRSNFNTVVSIYAGNTWLNVAIRDTAPSDSVRIYSYYYYPELLNKNNETMVSGLSNDGRFTITIESDGSTRTNNIYLNDVWQFETPFCYNNEKNTLTAYDQYVNPYLYFNIGNPPVGNWAALRLYEITQTIPAYSLVTPIPDSSLVSYGLDGPHPYNTVMNGIEIIKNFNGTGTIWADVGDIGSYSDENLTALKQLIADGWELGIHYSAGLTSKTMVNAIAFMNSEYNQIATVFGQAPTTWCSLQNADNKSHADYAYAQLNMVWRNGYNGVRGLSNIGNLCNNYWLWWNNASAAGVAAPSFTHETDLDPAISYSIGFGNLSTWVSNYESHGMRACGFYHYWTIAQNTEHSIISNLMIENDSMLSFTLGNIGGKSRLLIDADFGELVIDEDGNEVPFNVTDEGIVIEVSAGDYRIMTLSYYRQEQMEESFSPIFAIIPLVIILSVIPMVMGLGKKLK